MQVRVRAVSNLLSNSRLIVSARAKWDVASSKSFRSS
jgi:hypothetical protein